MAPLEPLKQFKCTFKDCHASFDKEKELRKHKARDPNHDYCYKCNLDFEDWDAFVHHKATTPGVHISCKYCGEDFKSTSGRDRHMKTCKLTTAKMHPVDQNLPCVGCNEVFTRAAALIDHLENGRCKKIGRDQFTGHFQHKNILTKLLENPELISSIAVNDWSEAARDDDVGGGVKLDGGLLERADEGARFLRQPVMQPEKAPQSIDPPKIPERWPVLGSEKKAHENETMNSLRADLEQISLEHTRQTDSLTTKNKENPVQSPMPSRNTRGNKETDFMPPHKRFTTTPSANSPGRSNTGVWGNGASSASKLFPKARETPVTTDWEEALKLRDEEAQRESQQNMFRFRFWDPTHKAYNPERFFNPIIEKYACPFPHCGNLYDLPLDMETHIRHGHAMTQVRCPSCLKLFKSITALVAHCEAPNGRCQIARSGRYGQAIDEFSGGFLGAKTAVRPDLTDPKDARINYVKYEATKPPDWDEEKEKNIVIGERGVW